MICAGIDTGSRTIKIVLLDEQTMRVVASGLTDQAVRQNEVVTGLYDRLLRQAGLRRGDVRRTVATGYGRNIVSLAEATITEITCHARGVRHLAPGVRTVIEIGGQDSKLLRLSEDGSVRDFAMNDRCAAGTGRFLEVVAARLGVDLGELGGLSARSRNPAAISSMCVVFAETEIIGLLASGAGPEDIVAGVQSAIASRVAAMVGRGVTAPVVFTGGVALVPGMDKALAAALGQPVSIAPDPMMTGALGAAILAGRD
jgi:predicted CoA-substrate-specific enzyme activase